MNLWNIGIDWDSEEEHETPEINMDVVDELMADGYTYQQAMMVAKTEMDGASEKNGIVHSYQTYCNFLNEEA